MALQVFDGFDDYGPTNNQAFLSKWSTSDGNGVTGQMAGLFSGYAIIPSDVNACCLTPLSSSASTVTVGGRFLRIGFTTSYYPALVVTNSIADVAGSPTLKAQLAGNFPTPTIQVINSAGTVLGTTPTQSVNFNEWYELEMQATISATTGSVTLKLNGVTILTLTNVNTQGTSSSNMIGAVGFIGSNNVCSTFWDDFYACDDSGSAPTNTFLSTVAGAMGPRVYTLFPNSDSSTAWTPLTGSSNFAMVDEQSFDGDTSYVYSSAALQQDLYGLPAAAGITGILAVKTSYVARMDDAGTREVAGSLESGGTVYQGATTTMTGNYQKVEDYYPVDPATSSAWNPAKFTTSGNVFIGVECVE